MEKESETKQELKFHFVLVHGVGHGAWCWYKVASILRWDGHEVTALDMAASGVNPIKMEELISLEDYARPLMEYMECLREDERVILVGHSMGGGVISIAMERFPEKISAAVFLTAYMPSPTIGLLTMAKTSLGKITDFMDTKITPEEENHLKPLRWGFNFLASKIYQLCPLEDLILASYLARPFPLSILRDPTKLSDEKYGTVRRVFVVCQEDILLKEDFQRWMIEENPPDEVKMIEGADHMAMMSRPRELSTSLLEIARDYARIGFAYAPKLHYNKTYRTSL